MNPVTYLSETDYWAQILTIYKEEFLEKFKADFRKAHEFQLLNYFSRIDIQLKLKEQEEFYNNKTVYGTLTENGIYLLNYEDFKELMNFCSEFLDKKLEELFLTTTPDSKNPPYLLSNNPDSVVKPQWTGNKTDFIKLVYALHYSKNIDDGKGEVTKITKYLADCLNVKYNVKDNSLTKSINKSINNGLDFFKFFDDLQPGLLKYVKRLKKQNGKQLGGFFEKLDMKISMKDEFTKTAN